MKTQWIESPYFEKDSAQIFRREFDAPAKPVKATLRATAFGTYVATINGKRPEHNLFTPGWTDYRTRVQVQTYDVTAFVRSGKNKIDLTLAFGWGLFYCPASDLPYRVTSNDYERPALWAELMLEYADGTKEKIGTNADWAVLSSRHTFAHHYNGETVDKTAKIRFLGKAGVSSLDPRRVPQEGETVEEQERLAPVSLLTTPAGAKVIDFGQNMTGYVEIRIRGKKGDRIRLGFAEVLDKDGNIYYGNYRSAKNDVLYVLSGKDDVFKPCFTFQGFRYVELKEYPGEQIDLSGITAVVVHSEMKRTGTFVCGNEKINQLYHNILWGQKSNYLEIPTDCPQRDERMGWTGDAQVFTRTAAIYFDVERFLSKWLRDMASCQYPGGSVPEIIPDPGIPAYGKGGSAGWGDAAVIMPVELYRAYGNKKILSENWEMMEKWISFMRHSGPEPYLWLGWNHHGDWLAMDNPDGLVGRTPTDYIASCYFAYSTSLMIEAGKILGKDVSEYESLLGNIKKAFRARFWKDGAPRLIPNGWKEGDPVPDWETETAYVLALAFGLVPDEEKQPCADRLADLIRANGTTMTTGFLGTPYILHVLSDNGYADLAYDLLLQEKYPSWLYSVNHGATTMWEHWNSIKEDGTFWSDSMNSFNHYAYGAVFDWIYGVALGIRPEQAGYKTFTVAPHPDRRLGFAETTFESRSGKLRVKWYYKGNNVYYELDVPSGTQASLTLPSGRKATLPAGSYCFVE